MKEWRFWGNATGRLKGMPWILMGFMGILCDSSCSHESDATAGLRGRFWISVTSRIDVARVVICLRGSLFPNLRCSFPADRSLKTHFPPGNAFMVLNLQAYPHDYLLLHAGRVHVDAQA
ncbi:hypothetical protein BJ508DRAFT_132107 [Ascobolus immersus RN42]|uniref:Secreted protein n=1 Tax=Ascobolus immersus RN42 TaxID=1160509 RepID=A0A3N4I7J3_ASCIM|nr:hypothetical protein BJ508DRAFT_132107 [Ascobolus immersus RN42]